MAVNVLATIVFLCSAPRTLDPQGYKSRASWLLAHGLSLGATLAVYSAALLIAVNSVTVARISAASAVEVEEPWRKPSLAVPTALLALWTITLTGLELSEGDTPVSLLARTLIFAAYSLYMLVVVAVVLVNGCKTYALWAPLTTPNRSSVSTTSLLADAHHPATVTATATARRQQRPERVAAGARRITRRVVAVSATVSVVGTLCAIAQAQHAVWAARAALADPPPGGFAQKELADGDGSASSLWLPPHDAFLTLAQPVSGVAGALLYGPGLRALCCCLAAGTAAAGARDRHPEASSGYAGRGKKAGRGDGDSSESEEEEEEGDNDADDDDDPPFPMDHARFGGPRGTGDSGSGLTSLGSHGGFDGGHVYGWQSAASSASVSAASASTAASARHRPTPARSASARQAPPTSASASASTAGDSSEAPGSARGLTAGTGLMRSAAETSGASAASVSAARAARRASGSGRRSAATVGSDAPSWETHYARSPRSDATSTVTELTVR